LIPDLSNRGLRRRSWVARIIFFVKRRFWSRCLRTALIDWLSGVDFVFVSSINGPRVSTNWSANHIVTLGIRYSDVFEGFGILRLAGSGLISKEAVKLLTRSPLISKLFSSWGRRPGAIDGLLAQSRSSWAPFSILRWLWAHLNVYW
jgi:hypothetical protein